MTQASILLVTYNSATFIASCLRSLDSVVGIKNAEILVWDNNSSDETVNIIQKEFPKVLVTTSLKNIGFGKAVNNLAKTANGEYLVLLNPDTQVDKNWLRPLLDTLDNNKNIAAVNSKTKIIIKNKPYIQNAGSYLFHDGHARDRGAVVTEHKEQLYEPDSDYFNKAIEVSAFSGVSVAIKKELFLKLGGFDERMFLYYEDTDLSIRLKKVGYKIWYQPKSELTHIHSASSIEWSDFFVFHTELNRLQLLLKHFKLKIILIELFFYFLSTIFQLVKFKKRFFIRALILLHLLKNAPYLILYRIKNND